MVTHGGIDFYTGILNGREVVILKAGVGKVNAAYSTAVLTQNFSLSHLIFTGVAGGLHPEALPGDLVIGEKLVQYDFGKVDSAGFTIWPFRQFAGGPEDDIYIRGDPDLLQIAHDVASSITFNTVAGRAPRVFSGVIATGDLFVSSSEKAGWLYKQFNALATEMEGAAVAHICQTLDVPFSLSAVVATTPTTMPTSISASSLALRRSIQPNSWWESLARSDRSTNSFTCFRVEIPWTFLCAKICSIVFLLALKTILQIGY